MRLNDRAAGGRPAAPSLPGAGLKRHAPALLLCALVVLAGCDDARRTYSEARALQRDVQAVQDAIADMHTPQPPSGWRGRASVVDGDTLEVRDRRFRLHGLDAPEAAQTCRKEGRAWPCGREAANRLADRIGRRNVHCEQRDRDRYDRIVAVCHVDGEDLNAWMVRNGWALAYRRYSRDYIDEEAQARALRVGIHAGSFVAPWTYRQRHGRR